MDNIPMTNNPASGTDNSVLNGFTVSSSASGLSAWAGNPDNVINNDLSDVYNGSIAITGSLTLNVRSNDPYNAGNFVGFRLSSLSLSALGDITISTLDASGNPIAGESRSGASLLAVSTGGVSEVGFYTNQPFYGVRLEISSGIGVGTYSVYYAFMRGTGSCADITLPTACNTPTMLAFPTHPVVAENSSDAVLAIGGITDLDNMVDNDASTFTRVTPVTGALGSNGVSVKVTRGEFPVNTYIGFDIQNTNILDVSVLSKYSIELYNNDGAVLQTIGGSAILANADVLGGSTRFVFGGVANVAFDEARLVFNSGGLANLSLGVTDIYQVIVKTLCDNRGEFACNTLTSLNNAIDPVFINWDRTGVTGLLAVGNSIAEADQLIDGNSATPAIINATVSAASPARISVKKGAGADYPANTYISFDVETDIGLIGVNAAANVTINLYNNGTLVPGPSPGNLLLIGAPTPVAGNSQRTRQRVGIVAPGAFDEAELVFSGLASVNLGEVNVYGVDVQRSCDHALACNTVNEIVNTPSGFGVVINNQRSGVSGVACAGCSVNDIGNVIDNDPNNFARMVGAAGVAATTAISVHAPASTFSAGTIAGFTIRTNSSLVGLDLFSAISVETYNNGVITGLASGSELLSLELLQLLTVGSTNGAVYNVGFITTAPYDEIRIAKSALVPANVAASIDIDVYNAFVDTRFVAPGSGSSCPVVYTLPDINYTTVNKPVQGSVATNDKQPANATYSGGTPVTGADGQVNPAGATLNLQSNGQYEFTATQPGVYSYETVMTDIATGQTYTENLTITVTDPAGSNPNPPVVNTDIAAVKSNTGAPGYTGVTIPVLENDKASNDGNTLGTPTIVNGPSNGTAQVNVDGTITYTPAPGFIGNDTLIYRVCEAPGGTPCGDAYVIIKVTPDETTVTTPDGPVTIPASGNIVAADDYNQTEAGQPVSGNVATNDKDPLGQPMTVTTQNITDVRGTLTLNANGTYTFTPANGFSGTASFVYLISDAGNSSRSANGTLYVHVAGADTPDLTPNLTLSTGTVFGTSEVDATVSIMELKSVNTSGAITVRIPAAASWTINLATGATEGIWTYGGVQTGRHVWTTNSSIAAGTSSAFHFKLNYTPPSNKGVELFTVQIVAGSGGDTNSLNDSDSENLQYEQ